MVVWGRVEIMGWHLRFTHLIYNMLQTIVYVSILQLVFFDDYVVDLSWSVFIDCRCTVQGSCIRAHLCV